MANETKWLDENESTLSRWSRLKRGATNNKNLFSKTDEKNPLPRKNGGFKEIAVASKIEGAALETPTAGDETTRGDELNRAVNSTAAAQSGEPDTPPLPPLESISLKTDFTPFMQAKVPEVLKRQALKTLFKEAHFNQMDGLDTYIDDYTQFDPISPEDLEKLSAWKSISKPLQQVVTPGGYAVDVESEEGKAVLAARRALEENEYANARESEVVSGESDESVAENVALPHERYGKRVSDFKPSDAAPVASNQREALGEGNSATLQIQQTESASVTRPIGRPLPLRTLEDPR